MTEQYRLFTFRLEFRLLLRHATALRFFFFLNDRPPPEIYPLPLPAALPICPRDPRIEAMLPAPAKQGISGEQARHEGGRLLGHRFGDLVDALLRAHPLKRLLLSGGDTSSHVTQRLAPQALRVVARLAPGAPLCRAISREPHLAQLEIALKGGQMGQPDYFVKALLGTADAHLSLA